MERKLASIQKVREVKPIKNADAIEVARVNNWDVVVKKGEYKPGDLCVYCEVDSFLPEKPEFEFLRKSSYKKMGDVGGFRLKTIKMRGQISQGLLLPLSVLNSDETPYSGVWVEGDDVTEMLGIVKYEPPIPAELAGKMKGNFPSFVVKTDEERIQNMTDEFEQIKKLQREQGVKFYETEKLDGCLNGSTILQTEDGLKTIRDICENKYSGKVKTYDVNTKKSIFSKITHHMIKHNDAPNPKKWYKLKTSSGKIIKLTGNHKVFLPELGCWRRTDELTGNEKVLIL